MTAKHKDTHWIFGSSNCVLGHMHTRAQTHTHTYPSALPSFSASSSLPLSFSYTLVCWLLHTQISMLSWTLKDSVFCHQPPLIGPSISEYNLWRRLKSYHHGLDQQNVSISIPVGNHMFWCWFSCSDFLLNTTTQESGIPPQSHPRFLFSFYASVAMIVSITIYAYKSHVSVCHPYLSSGFQTYFLTHLLGICTWRPSIVQIEFIFHSPLPTHSSLNWFHLWHSWS